MERNGEAGIRGHAAPDGAGRPGSAWVLLRLAAAIAILAALVLLAAATLVEIPASGTRQTVVFYALPTSLAPGAPVERDDLEQRLGRLGYRPVRDEEMLEPGRYRRVRGDFDIWLRPFRYPDRDFPGGLARVRISGGEVAEVEQAEGGAASDDLRLEPELIAGFEGGTGAVLTPLHLDDAPPLLVHAIIAVEDHRFWKHPGVDPIGTARALVTNARRGEAAQGGSTLTQQLARSLFLHNRKTILRKAQEVVLAFALEIRYSKREILEAYLNAVYWGHWGPFEIRGAREAARYYLGCELEDADPAGIALLVGLVPAPNANSPYVSPERARRCRDLVIARLRERGVLDEKEARAALARKIPTRKPPVRSADASYFLEAARKEVERRAPGGILSRPHLAVFTTLDPRAQSAAVGALRVGLRDLENEDQRLRRKKDPLQGAAVLIDPSSGEVRALVGGRDFAESPFNRATDALRQPGSLFKPFVYLAALRERNRADGEPWTATTLLVDEPFEMRSGGTMWRPENYDHENRGEITLRQALEQSINVPAARVGNEVGIERVARAARDLGIASPLEDVPSLALGTSEVTLLEITAAYAALADGGRVHAPTLLRGVLDPDGAPVPLESLADAPGIDPALAYVMTSLLRGVVEEGTGRGAWSYGVRAPVAGKTGTTDDYRDAWFVGYSPRWAAGVWVGFDREETVGLSGAAAALPIWARLFASVQGHDSDGEFLRPEGVVTASVDPETGLLATPWCFDAIEEDFLAGTEPVRECDVHSGGFFAGLRRLFGI
jgi:penicillin-binding protein 1B